MTVVFLVFILGTQLFSLAPPAAMEEVSFVAREAAEQSTELVGIINRSCSDENAQMMKPTEVKERNFTEVFNRLQIRSKKEKDAIMRFIHEAVKNKEVVLERYKDLKKFLEDKQDKENLLVLKANQKWIQVCRSIEHPDQMVVVDDGKLVHIEEAIESLVLLAQQFNQFDTHEFDGFRKAKVVTKAASFKVQQDDLMSLTRDIPGDLLATVLNEVKRNGDIKDPRGLAARILVIKEQRVAQQQEEYEDDRANGEGQLTVEQDGNYLSKLWERENKIIFKYEIITMIVIMVRKSAEKRLRGALGDEYTGDLTFAKLADLRSKDVVWEQFKTVDQRVESSLSLSVRASLAAGEGSTEFNIIKGRLVGAGLNQKELEGLVSRMVLNGFKGQIEELTARAETTYKNEAQGAEVRKIGATGRSVVVLQKKDREATMEFLKAELNDSSFGGCGYNPSLFKAKKSSLFSTKKGKEEKVTYTPRSSDYQTLVESKTELMVPCMPLVGNSVPLKVVIENYMRYIDTCQDEVALERATQAMQVLSRFLDRVAGKKKKVSSLATADSLMVYACTAHENVAIRQTSLIEERIGGIYFGLVATPDPVKVTTFTDEDRGQKVQLKELLKNMREGLSIAVDLAASRFESFDAAGTEGKGLKQGAITKRGTIGKTYTPKLRRYLTALASPSSGNFPGQEVLGDLQSNLLNLNASVDRFQLKSNLASQFRINVDATDTLSLVNGIICACTKRDIPLREIEKLRHWLHIRLMLHLEGEGLLVHETSVFKVNRRQAGPINVGSEQEVGKGQKIRGMLSSGYRVFRKVLGFEEIEGVDERRLTFIITASACGTGLPKTVRLKNDSEGDLAAATQSASLPKVPEHNHYGTLVAVAESHAMELASELIFYRANRSNVRLETVDQSAIQFIRNNETQAVEGIVVKSLDVGVSTRALRVLFPGNIALVAVPSIVQVEAQDDEREVGREVTKLGFIKKNLVKVVYHENGTKTDESEELNRPVEHEVSGTESTKVYVQTSVDQKLGGGVGAMLSAVDNSWQLTKSGSSDSAMGYSTLAFAQFTTDWSGQEGKLKQVKDATVMQEVLGDQAIVTPAFHENMHMLREVGLAKEEEVLQAALNWLVETNTDAKEKQTVREGLQKELNFLATKGLIRIDAGGNVLAVEEHVAELWAEYTKLSKDDGGKVYQRAIVDQIMLHLNYISLKNTLAMFSIYKLWVEARIKDGVFLENQWLVDMKAELDNLADSFNVLEKVRLGSANVIAGITSGEDKRLMENLATAVVKIFSELKKHSRHATVRKNDQEGSGEDDEEDVSSTQTSEGSITQMLDVAILTSRASNIVKNMKPRKMALVNGFAYTPKKVSRTYQNPTGLDMEASELQGPKVVKNEADYSLKTTVEQTVNDVNERLLQELERAKKADADTQKLSKAMRDAGLQVKRALALCSVPGVQDYTKEWKRKVKSDAITDSPEVQQLLTSQNSLQDPNLIRGAILKIFHTKCQEKQLSYDGLNDSSWITAAGASLPLGVASNNNNIDQRDSSNMITHLTANIKGTLEYRTIFAKLQSVCPAVKDVDWEIGPTITIGDSRCSTITGWYYDQGRVKIVVSQSFVENLCVTCYGHDQKLDLTKLPPAVSQLVQALLLHELVQAACNLTDVKGDTSQLKHLLGASRTLMEGILARGQELSRDEGARLSRTDFTGLCYAPDTIFATIHDNIAKLAQYGVDAQSIEQYQREILQNIGQWRQNNPSDLTALTADEIQKTEYPVFGLTVIQNA